MHQGADKKSKRLTYEGDRRSANNKQDRSSDGKQESRDTIVSTYAVKSVAYLIRPMTQSFHERSDIQKSVYINEIVWTRIIILVYI